MEDQRVEQILREIDVKLANLNGQNREWQRGAERRLEVLEGGHRETNKACVEYRAEIWEEIERQQKALMETIVIESGKAIAAVKETHRERKHDLRWWLEWILKLAPWAVIVLGLAQRGGAL